MIFDIAQRFLAKPYIAAPCGEGPLGMFNQRPLYREDGFDCLTFVNAVLAYFFSKNTHDLLDWVLCLNYYAKEIDFLKRFHFMSADWCIELVRLKLINDMTAVVAHRSGVAVSIANTYINRQQWLQKRTSKDLYFCEQKPEPFLRQRLIQLQARSKELVNVSVATPYIPLTELFDGFGQCRLEVLEQIEDNTVLLIVRPDWDLTASIGTHLNVSHLGIVGRVDGQIMFRHASSIAGAVVEVSLVEYLSAYLHSPTVKGVAIYGCCL